MSNVWQAAIDAIRANPTVITSLFCTIIGAAFGAVLTTTLQWWQRRGSIKMVPAVVFVHPVGELTESGRHHVYSREETYGVEVHLAFRLFNQSADPKVVELLSVGLYGADGHKGPLIDSNLVMFMNPKTKRKMRVVTLAGRSFKLLAVKGYALVPDGDSERQRIARLSEWRYIGMKLLTGHKRELNYWFDRPRNVAEFFGLPQDTPLADPLADT